MERFRGTCEFLAYPNPATLSAVIAWVQSFPLEAWPMQSCAGEPIRPAMPSNLLWQGFGAATDEIISETLAYFPRAFDLQRMLGCIMPGHSIQSHKDYQCEQWLCRVHIPLQTCPGAVMIMDDGEHHMEVGKSYRINTEASHALRNDGDVPRIHLMFDVREP